MSDDRKSLKYEWSGDVLTVTDEDANESESFDFGEVPKSLDADFLELGRRTKLGNYASDAKKKKLRKMDMMREGFASLRDGEWEREREKLPDWMKGRADAIRALAELTGADEASIKETLKGMPEKTGIGTLDHPTVKEKAAEYAAARKSRKTVDLSAFMTK